MRFLSPKHVTLRTFLAVLIVLVGLTFFSMYVLFQARYLIEGPRITIEGPMETVHEDRAITLRGYAENIVRITLNDRQIYTDENGYFEETLVLENGYTIVTLRAQDRYGRKTTETRSFVYKPTNI